MTGGNSPVTGCSGPICASPWPLKSPSYAGGLPPTSRSALRTYRKKSSDCAGLTRQPRPDEAKSGNSPLRNMKGESMPERSGHHFHHRFNREGTHDSFCSTCYMTVATTSEEFELVGHEDVHICDPVRLYQVSQCSYYPPTNLERGVEGPRRFMPLLRA